MSAPTGVIAAGHPLTAEAGAGVLRSGGNAVDAAVCAVLTSFAVESPLTGFGAGGFMLVHTGSENSLIDFFVEAPGRDGVERDAELVPVPVFFDETPQTFNVGAASCGVPGTAAGLALALERFGSASMGDLIDPGARHAREGAPLNAQQAYILKILEPILTSTDQARALYAPAGRMLREGELFRFADLADALERFAAEGPDPFYSGQTGRAVADWVRERGGTLSPEDMASYRAVERTPVEARFHGTDVLSNPPPSSGGVLIALCMALLERLGDTGVAAMVAVMEAAQASRDEAFHAGLFRPGFADHVLDPATLDELAAHLQLGGKQVGGDHRQGDQLGSTTHLAVLDGEGRCATVTCSNGTGSGLIVPGTGVHVNNMLGEEDLNPLGFHLAEPGTRIPSMMAPTVVLRDGEVVIGLGSAGSNRIRSAILQTIVRLVAEGRDIRQAVEAPRLHFEEGAVQAEPGVDEDGLAALEARGYPVARWQRQNLYFGGVQAVARDPRTGELSGGGDPRRGGAVVVI
jgi:gamma-glutamyltranspeptidase/glutathione hydrolase